MIYMSQIVKNLNSQELDALNETMRSVERKFAMVYTLFKSSIYSHLSQQNQPTGNDGLENHHDLSSNYGDSTGGGGDGDDGKRFVTNCPAFSDIDPSEYNYST
ncbi:hypothetical protein H4219_005699 [Mycoemilia scoparia]|uniref:Uncharacterized protein n=1 Tax=Mycoemilia scoparia TaxID=417184 RepID=A0A9W7ZV27_9FUNG|nr:hypothetical protein H4219_005699 [Mycoemilia scoparia]